MVGKRTWANGNGADPQNGSTRQRKPPISRQGTKEIPPRLRKFTDTVDLALEDQRRDEVKDTLLKAVNKDYSESFRKSDEELKAIKNKKIRKFYEQQNYKLNDWLEV